jgi:hypothetical protein
MKDTYLSLMLSLISLSGANANERLKNYCAHIGGKVVKEYICPKSKLKLGWDFCVSKDQSGVTLFFDGCTGPSGGHADLFYPACVKHDYCYHHEPSSNGYKQIDCDKQFLNEALDLCTQADDQKKCRNWAKAMYRAVRGFGGIAFNCADYEANY